MLTRIYRKIKKLITPPTERELRVRQWKRSGSEKLRYTYNLDENSIVFDMGGYKGEWSSDIFSMYLSEVYVFEPVKSYFTDIKERFSKNPNIKVFQFGLSKETVDLEIGMDNDGSSTFSKSTHKELIQLRKASDFLKEHNIQTVDLIKINIEGGEYDLLEHLIESRLIEKFKNIQVQFHDFVPKAEERMKKIRTELEKTHTATYQSDFVWENWKIKN